MDSNSRQYSEDTVLTPLSEERHNKKSKDDSKENCHRTLKVELQTIRLKPDSQKMVLDTLKFIHGPDFKLGSASCYKDKQFNLGNRYWMERGNLVVRGGIDYSAMSNPDIQTSEARLRSFAIAKLEKYHFHKTHCAEALLNCGESVDKALEVLFTKYFKHKTKPVPDNIPTPSELLEMRNDEKAVLESIYDTSFKVIDKNVWVVLLKLNYLTKFYQEQQNETKNKVKSNYKTNFKTKKKDVCKLYLKGPCRYGSKCKFLHETENDKTQSLDLDESLDYELEIRFPEGTLYPFETPLVFLKCPYSTIVPQITCLRLTARMYEEAQTLAQDGVSSIFSLVELINNEEEMLDFIKNDTRTFPEPTDMLYPELVEDANENEKKPTHYKKSKVRDNKTKTSEQELVKRNKEIAMDHLDKQNSVVYNKMYTQRVKLPAFSKKTEIVQVIKSNQVVVISGDTGCGKSTQIPQYILDDWLDNFFFEGKNKISNTHMEIICTQPRRISAIAVAERVAEERLESVGNVVGYQIRLESKVSDKTRLLFCTTGILLRRLETDPELKSVTHVVVDEVHERSDESDFLLLILRDLLKVRKDLKVVLMSATMKVEQFSDYFSGAPIVRIPGRSYPVKQLFLEDIMDITEYVLEENSPYARKIKKGDKKFDLEIDIDKDEIRGDTNGPPPAVIRDENLSISRMGSRYPQNTKQTWKNLYFMDPDKINEELIVHILTYLVRGEHDWPKHGSVLIFLPGLAEITSLHDKLSDDPVFGTKSNKYMLIPLHSSLSSEEQTLVFKKPRKGFRKIILSTNIAETSITIDDCVFVIDTGKMKEKRFDSNRNMESLELVWVSRANAKQRMGRAGRVMPGVCVHLFTYHRFHHHLAEQPIPEIQRVPLEQLLLKIMILPLFDDMCVHEVLDKTIEPPSKSSIDGALARLREVGAIDGSLELTPLGRHLAALPVDVRIGKLMLFGAIFCCVDSALTIAACLSHKSPFVAPFGKKAEADAKRREFACANSDQLTSLKAYRKWQEIVQRGNATAINFCNENFLSHKTLIMLADIKHQLLTMLVSIGFVPKIAENKRKPWFRDRVGQITGEELNANGSNEKLLAAILCAALYPNVVKVLTPEKSFQMQASGAIPRQPSSDELRFKTKSDGYVTIHPSSVNANVGHFTSPYLVYQEKVKTSRIFIRECSMVPNLPLVLFSGSGLTVELFDGNFVVSLEDRWILFKAESHEVAEMLKTIRQELVNLLDEKINDPCLNLLNYEKGRRIINTIVHIISREN